MGRKRTKIWISSRVRLIKELILLFLDTHPLGFNVLTGAARWPDGEELAEWLSFVFSSRSEDVHVQSEPSVFEAQRRIESAESAKRAFDAFDRYGGAARVYAVMEQYRKAYPDNYELLRKVGNAGLPGAKSLEAVAGEYYCDVKTLRRREAAIAEDIASGVVYGEGTSFSLVHDPDKDKRNERNRWRGTEKFNSP